jgi:hypothetical protein
MSRLHFRFLVSTALLLVLSQQAGAQSTDTLLATAGVPRYPVGIVKPFLFVVYVQGVRITAKVTNLPAKQPNESDSAASQRKAAAVIKVLNDSITAAKADGRLPGTQQLATLTKQPGMVPNVDKDGKPLPGPALVANRWVNFGIVTLVGTTGVGSPGGLYKDPSGEGNGTAIIRKGGLPSGVKASMGGAGAGTGLSTGLDPLGAPSFVSFGVFDPRGLDADCQPDFPPAYPLCPGEFIATLFPSAGSTDSQILSGLASLFNSLFAPFGYTASYDPFTDLLSLDQPIGNYETLFTQNTDSGLELDPVLEIITPEPATLPLLAPGILAIGLLWLLHGRGRGSAEGGRIPLSRR